MTVALSFGSEQQYGEVQFSTDNLLTVVALPTVLVPRAVQLKCGHKVMAYVDATYDFTGVPERYHRDLLNMIPRPQVLLLPWEDCVQEPHAW